MSNLVPRRKERYANDLRIWGTCKAMILDELRAVRALWRHRLYRPANLMALVRTRESRNEVPIGEECLTRAMEWLCRAQDVTGCGGVSEGWSFRRGWGAAYPETTGYIVETFYDYAQFSGDETYRDRARRMADWLCSVQMSSGAFQGGPIDVKPRPVVFNTGPMAEPATVFMGGKAKCNTGHVIVSCPNVRLEYRDWAWVFGERSDISWGL